MSILISEYIKFIALYFKSKDAMVFNGLIGLGTVVSQTAYNILAFDCPCLPKKNYLYGLAAIGVPALGFFVIGVMLNQNTWDVVSECRTRKCRKLSLTAAFALLGSIVGRAVVAPITWTVISLLRGEAYVCAFSEFMKLSSLHIFSSTTPGPEVMARFPCKDVPAPFMNYSGEVERQLKYESQVLITFYIVVIVLNCINTSDMFNLIFFSLLHLAVGLVASGNHLTFHLSPSLSEKLLLSSWLSSGGILVPVLFQRTSSFPAYS